MASLLSIFRKKNAVTKPAPSSQESGDTFSSAGLSSVYFESWYSERIPGIPHSSFPWTHRIGFGGISSYDARNIVRILQNRLEFGQHPEVESPAAAVASILESLRGSLPATLYEREFHEVNSGLHQLCMVVNRQHWGRFYFEDFLNKAKKTRTVLEFGYLFPNRDHLRDAHSDVEVRRVLVRRVTSSHFQGVHAHGVRTYRLDKLAWVRLTQEQVLQLPPEPFAELRFSTNMQLTTQLGLRNESGGLRMIGETPNTVSFVTRSGFGGEM